MDKLERAEEERIRREETLQAARVKREERPRTDMPETDYPVTIIGCIRGVDGWYQAGYDKRKQTIILLQMIQRRSIFSGDDCPMCANSNRKTNSCRFLPIDGGTPCRYYHLRPELENHEH